MYFTLLSWFGTIPPKFSYSIGMKNLILHFLFGSIFSITVAQEYDISECINIALDRKGTLVSAGLDVESANQGVKVHTVVFCQD